MKIMSQWAARGWDHSTRTAATQGGTMQPTRASYPYLGNGVYPDTHNNRKILQDRGVPFVETPNQQIYFASLGYEGGFALIDGALIRPMTSYLDDQRVAQAVPRSGFGLENMPADTPHLHFEELLHGETPLGRDYGPPKEWLGAILSQGVFSGDPAESLRRQVAVDALRHPTLARWIDPGTGQVNPLQWPAFLDAAHQAGLPMLISSNGVANFYQQARDNIRLLAEGSNVLAINVFNPTIDGGFMSDALAESLPSMMGQRQTVQVAIECELRAAIVYNRTLDASRARPSGTTRTRLVSHSQGTIHGNLAADRLKPDEKKHISVVNVGTASTHLPQGLQEFISIADKGDPVVAGTASRKITQHPYALTRQPHYRLVETDIAHAVGPHHAGNRHSFYLYAQTAAFQHELAFSQRPQGLLISRPFVSRLQRVAASHAD